MGIAQMWVLWDTDARNERNLPMSRITIDVTAEEHQKLKALAALQGLTIKDYVLGRIIRVTPSDEEVALEELHELLKERLENYEKTGPSQRTVAEIFEQSYRGYDTGKNA
jgi:hypothetical protein